MKSRLRGKGKTIRVRRDGSVENEGDIRALRPLPSLTATPNHASPGKVWSLGNARYGWIELDVLSFDNNDEVKM